MATVKKITKKVEVIKIEKKEVYHIELSEEEAMALIAVVGRVSNTRNDRGSKLYGLICQLYSNLGDAGIPYGYEKENIFHGCIKKDMELN